MGRVYTKKDHMNIQSFNQNHYYYRCYLHNDDYDDGGEYSNYNTAEIG